jgi:prepilin-type N-terminal cleavage/methylation domain-containing protein
MTSLRRAFTLIEVAVTLAIAGVIVAVASTVIVQLNTTLKMQTVRLQADEEAKLLAEWLVFQMRGLGGDDLRPWEAVFVENNCVAKGDMPACDGSDRLIVRVVDPDLSSCLLTGASGANLEATLMDSPPLGNGDGLFNKLNDACCLDVFRGAVVGTSPWLGRSAIVLDSTRVAHPVRLHQRTSSGGDGCAVNVPGALPPSLDRALVANGRLIMASQKVFFRAPATAGQLIQGGLYEFTDIDLDNRFDSGELRLVADNVFDFQVALGYDHDKDGRAVENGLANDEWRFNTAAETLPNPFVDDALRQLGVGIIVGVKVPQDVPQAPLRIFDGPTRSAPKTLLRGTIVRATLRNVFLFD